MKGELELPLFEILKNTYERNFEGNS